MTREENLHWIDQEIQTWENECQSKHPIKEALYATRKALEQEPCEDAVSRKSVITIIQNHWWNCRDIDKLVNDLPSVTPQEPRWIPVTEKLPEEKTAVLLSCDDMYLAKLNPCIGWRNGNYWHTFSAKGSYLVKYPIAWMPLPQPYKAESEVKE